MGSKHETRARHTGPHSAQKLPLRRGMAAAALVGMTASVALGAFAKEYYLDYGDVTVNAREEGNFVSYTDEAGVYFEDEKNLDGEIIVTQESEEAVKNTLTIEAEEDTTVEVTIRDVEIDATDKIDPSKKDDTSSNYESAILVKGEGDVVLELDGENEVESGRNHAGVEKNDKDGTGTLTIQDKDNNGSLTAKGGTYGAGIGGGDHEDSSHLIIDGGTITATGGYYGAGIGGGNRGDSSIKISGGTVTATGGRIGAGIGGGNRGDGNVTITEGTVTVETENATKQEKWITNEAAGIGAGMKGDGTVTISGGTVNVTMGMKDYGAGIGGAAKGDATVTITGGTVTVKKANSFALKNTFDAGAGIGGGEEGNATVTITGGTVTANGGTEAAGIGAGDYGSATVSISGGTVIAKGGISSHFDTPAQDIGGGGYAQKDADQITPSTVNWTAGTIIKPVGDGTCQHDWTNGTVELVGADTCVDPGEKHTTCPLCGSIRKELQPYEHAWDAGVQTETGDTLYTCTVCGTTRTESAPELEASAPAALDVTNLYSAAQPYDKTVENGRVIFAAPAENAVLTGSLAALAELKAQGADTIVFRTPLKETALSIDWLLEQGSEDDVFALTHKGTEASLTVAGWNVRM